MKEILVKIVFDDTDGYKGHGDNVGDLIVTGIKTFLEFDLEQDSVIKSNWSVNIIKE
jgi:hypothetical protein